MVWSWRMVCMLLTLIFMFIVVKMEKKFLTHHFVIFLGCWMHMPISREYASRQMWMRNYFVTNNESHFVMSSLENLGNFLSSHDAHTIVK